MMLTCEYLRRQAALCLRIAAAVDDRSVMAALVVMADDFSVRADEIDPSLQAASLCACHDAATDGSRTGGSG
jgi:hypothetical protein